MCRLISYLVPDGPPYYANSMMTKTVTKCEEHSWMMDGAIFGDPPLCPIGRIEQAVQDGLAKLKAAGT